MLAFRSCDHTISYKQTNRFNDCKNTSTLHLFSTQRFVYFPSYLWMSVLVLLVLLSLVQAMQTCSIVHEQRLTGKKRMNKVVLDRNPGKNYWRRLASTRSSFLIRRWDPEISVWGPQPQSRCPPPPPSSLLSHQPKYLKLLRPRPDPNIHDPSIHY